MATEIQPIFETARLRLRPCTERDLDGLHAAVGDPEAMRYWDGPLYADRDETARLLRWLMKPNLYSHVGWAVAGREDDACRGFVNYHHRESRDRRLEVGYILAPRYWRQGLMTEAMIPFLKHCFETLKTHRAEAYIDPGNLASCRLIEGLGFKRESGVIRDRWRIDDSYRSAVLYARLDTD